MVGCLFLTEHASPIHHQRPRFLRSYVISLAPISNIVQSWSMEQSFHDSAQMTTLADPCDRGNGREEEETKKNRYTGYARSCLINTPPLTQNTEIDTNTRRKCAEEKAKEITITRVSRVTCVIPTRCGARNSDAMRSRDRYAIGRSIVGLNAALVYSVCQLNINRRRRTRTGPQQLRIADAIGHLTAPRRGTFRDSTLFHISSYSAASRAHMDIAWSRTCLGRCEYSRMENEPSRWCCLLREQRDTLYLKAVTFMLLLKYDCDHNHCWSSSDDWFAPKISRSHPFSRIRVISILIRHHRHVPQASGRCNERSTMQREEEREREREGGKPVSLPSLHTHQ